MAPTPYKRTFSFTGSVSANPNFVPAAFGVGVDAELDQIGATVGAVAASLAQIQRADGALANGIVTLDSMNPALLATFQGYVAASAASATASAGSATSSAGSASAASAAAAAAGASAAASANSAGLAAGSATAAAASAAQAAINAAGAAKGLSAFVDIWPNAFGVFVMDGVTDMAPLIQAALDYAGRLGGGIVRLPAGNIGISSSLNMNYPNVKFRGVQADGNHDVAGAGVGWTGSAAQSLGTQLVWNGPSGIGNATTSSDIVVCQSKQAAQLGGIEVSGLKGVPGATVPNHLVHAIGVQNSVFDDLFGIELNGYVLFGDCSPSTANTEGSFWKNRIGSLTIRMQNSGGGALKFAGNGYNNCYDNQVDLIQGEYKNGHAVYLGDCDNNQFYHIRVQRLSPASGQQVYGRGIYLSADGYGARTNEFFHCLPGAGGVYAEGTEAGKKDPSGNVCASVNNRIFLYNPIENSPPPAPQIGNGATLDWSSTETVGAFMQVHVVNASAVGGYATVAVGFDTVDSNSTGSGFKGGDDHNYYDFNNKWFFPKMPGAYRLTLSVSATTKNGDGANAVGQVILKKVPISNAAQNRETRQRMDYWPNLTNVQKTFTIDAVMQFDGVTDCCIPYFACGAGQGCTINIDQTLTYFMAERLA